MLSQDYCEEIGTKVCYASVAHPQSNGQVERANGMILQGIKTRVFDWLKSYSRHWVHELPTVLWSLWTTPSWAIAETPFFLVFGAEAMLPLEIALQSPRVSNYSKDDQVALPKDDINVIEEFHDHALI